jgi:hypothetical protein
MKYVWKNSLSGAVAVVAIALTSSALSAADAAQ